MIDINDRKDPQQVMEKTSNRSISTPAIKRGWLRAVLFYIVAFITLQISGVAGFVIVALAFDINLAESIQNMDTVIENLGVFPYLIISVFAFLGMFLFLWIFRKFIDKKSIISLGFSFSDFKKDLFYGMLWGASLILFGFLLLYILGMLEVTEFRIDLTSLFGYLLLFIVVSFTEEILVRGYILNNLNESMNKYVALLVSSILFAIGHLLNPNMDILPFINLIIAGVLLGIYYIHVKNLWFPIGMHITWNYFQGPVFGFEVSGNKTSSIIVQKIQGNDLITGGEFGFEGSLLATVIMLVLIILIDRKYKNI